MHTYNMQVDECDAYVCLFQVRQLFSELTMTVARACGLLKVCETFCYKLSNSLWGVVV